MADIFDEVSEELKRDNMAEFWNTYKYAVYGVAGLLVVGIGSFSGYKEYMTEVNKENSALFDKGVGQLQAGDVSALNQVIFEGEAGYATLSAMKLAQYHIAQGRFVEASKALKPLSESENAPYNSLATILYALYSDEAPVKMLALIKPEMEDGKPWRHQAFMVGAELALRAGDDSTAKVYLEKLTGDATTPATTLALARQILNTLQ